MEKSERKTRAQWLMLEVALLHLDDGVPLGLVQEAVATTALEHPEWDMHELMTREEWEARANE